MPATVDSCLYTVKTEVSAVPWTTERVPQVGRRPLIKSRFLHLVAALSRELGSERKAALRLGVHPTFPGKVRDDPKRFIGIKTLETIERELGLAERFFTDPSIGATPDYRKYKTGAERTPTSSPYAQFNAYIDDELAAGRMLESHARDLRLVRIPGDVTWGMASSLHREMLARDRTTRSTPASGIKPATAR